MQRMPKPFIQQDSVWSLLRILALETDVEHEGRMSVVPVYIKESKSRERLGAQTAVSHGQIILGMTPV